jgi:hypothetical protein
MKAARMVNSKAVQLCLVLIVILVVYTPFNSTIKASNEQIYSDWSVFTIDDTDSGAYVHHSNTSIAVDSADNIHISYRGPDINLKHAVIGNRCLFTEVVYETSPVARENSIAIDSNDLPHISFSYSDGHAEDLMYAEKPFGPWEVTSIDVSGSVGMENDIAVDRNDKVHISHWQWSYNLLKYSTNKSGVWETEVITNAAWDRTSIVVDKNSSVHIVYTDLNDTLTYTTNRSGLWEMTPIDNCISNCSPAIAIDSSELLHVSYSSADDLKYATNITGSWLTFTVASTVNAGRHHSIALDKANNAHISYFDSIEGNLQYANNITGLWSVEIVDNTSGAGRSNSIAIDSNNGVSISYRYDIVSGSGHLSDVWGSSATDVFAVGIDGVILHYDGSSWSAMDSGTDAPLAGVWGSSSSDVFAVGGSGTILHYNGNGWGDMSTGTNSFLHGIWGISPSNIFVVGDSGTILHYDGYLWSEVVK